MFEDELEEINSEYQWEREDRDYGPVYCFQLRRGFPEYSFSLQSVAEDRRHWLSEVITKTIIDAYYRGKEQKTKEVVEAIDATTKMLGLSR